MPEYVKLIRKSGDINELARRDKERVSRALGESAQVGASIARQLVPVRTGFLRDSIFVEQTSAVRFLIGAQAAYATFVIKGTIYQDGNDFMTPAIEMARRHLRSLLSK